MALPSLKNLQKQTGRQFFCKVLIRDDNSKWVDFSDRTNKDQDKVLVIPKIKTSTDARFMSSQYTSSVGNLVVDNSDRFWDNPVSLSMKTEDGSTASFSTKISKNNSETVWAGRYIRFKLVEMYKENQYREKSLGTFKIDDVITDLTGKATLKIVGLEKALQERDASTVKNGKTPYQHRSISFLVKQLLAVECGDENSGIIPTTYNVADKINLSTYDGSNTLSVLGPAPLNTDTDRDGVPDIFYERNKECRAMCLAPVDPNSGGAVDTLYLGIENELYSYNPSTDMYTTENTTGLDSTYRITNMWYNSTARAIHGTAETEPSTTQSVADDTWMHVSIAFFRYRSESLGIEVLATKNGLNGRAIMRDGYGYEDDPDSWARWTGVSSEEADKGGEAIFLPYPQTIRVNDLGGSDDDFVLVDEVDSSVTYSPNGYDTAFPDRARQYVATINRYYNAAGGQGEDQEYRTPNVRFSWGQQGCLCYNENIGSHGMIFFAQLRDEGSHSYVIDYKGIYMYNGSEETLSQDVKISVDGTEVRAWPISCVAKDINFVIGMVGFKENTTAALGTGAYIKFFDFDESTFSTIYAFDGAGDSGKVPVEIYRNTDLPEAAGEGYNDLAICLMYTKAMSRTNFGGTPYSLYLAPSDVTGGTDIDTRGALISEHMNQPKGFVTNSSGDTYFVRNQSGYLEKHLASDYTSRTDPGTPTVQDSGFPIADDNTYLRTSLVLDTVTRSGTDILWGIASPVFDTDFIQTQSLAWKNYTFKHDSVISETVQLADFEGLSIWNALGLLAQRSNCIMGHDEDGNFFFQPRSLESSSSHTINVDEGEAISVKKMRGKENVFNYVEITPYLTQFEQPSYKAVFQKREDTTEENDTIGEDEVELRQNDSLAKELTLICTQDGDANIGSGKITGYPLFKFGVYESVITGRFTSNYSGTGTTHTLEVASTFGGADTEFGIKVGYYLHYTDSNENEYYYRITRVTDDEIDVVTDSSTTVTVYTNDEFKVIRSNRIATTNPTSQRVWSDEGVTFISTGSTGASTSQTVNSTNGLSVNTIIIVGSQKPVRITAISGTTLTVDSAIDTSDNDIVRAYFAPFIHSTWFEIGDSDIELRMGSTGNKSIFRGGDRITITCKGLVLNADDKSKQVAVNVASIQKHRKNQYPNINNRFLTRRLAQQTARKIRTDWCYPKYIFQARLPLSNYFDILGSTALQKITLRSKELLPYRPGYQEDCRIVNIQHDPNQGITDLTLMSDSFY